MFRRLVSSESVPHLRYDFNSSNLARSVRNVFHNFFYEIHIGKYEVYSKEKRKITSYLYSIVCLILLLEFILLLYILLLQQQYYTTSTSTHEPLLLFIRLRKYNFFSTSNLENPNENPTAKQKLAPCSLMGLKSIEFIILASLFLNGI